VEVARDRGERERLDGLGGTADVAAEGLAGPERLIDEDAGKLGRTVLDAGQLLEDDRALFFEFGTIHDGVADHIGEDVDGLHRGGVGHLGVVDGDLPVGGCVVHSPDTLDGLGNITRGGPAGSTLEEHVLEEMGEPGFGIELVTAARADVHADRRRTGMRHFAGDDAEAVGECGSFVHGATGTGSEPAGSAIIRSRVPGVRCSSRAARTVDGMSVFVLLCVSTSKENDMSARLTVVLDDEELYRRLKVKAAQDGVPMKDLIERGLRLVIEQAGSPAVAAKAFDWDEYEAMLERLREEDEALGIDPEGLPTDLSEIKHHLYGYPKPAGRLPYMAAEEPAQYDAP